MEVELKDKYAKLCGKDGKRNNEGDLCEGYESDDESLEAYDGFAGDDEEIRVERTAAVWLSSFIKLNNIDISCIIIYISFSRLVLNKEFILVHREK